MLPLVRDMPIQLTGTEDIAKKAFKNARGKLRGWTLSKTEAERVERLAGPEVVLEERPLTLRIELTHAQVDTKDDAEANILILKPQVRVWTRDKEGQAKVRRIGFPIVPEFGGTVHAYCGENLDASIADLPERTCSELTSTSHAQATRTSCSLFNLIARSSSAKGNCPGPD